MRYASFLVRIWLPDEETTSGEPVLRGTVEHVQSGTANRLTCLEDVLVFIYVCVAKKKYDESEQQATMKKRAKTFDDTDKKRE